jgi:Flp pilus assembly pilin Flp
MSPRFSRLSVLRRLTRCVRRFGKDARGATAVEFGLIATPFLIFVFGIMTVGAQYMTAHLLEAGLETTARKLRTGEAQKAGLTLSQFRQMYCDAAGFMITCDEHLVIHINGGTQFADLPRVRCLTSDGRLAPSPGGAGDSVSSRAGDASRAVKVNVCYDWKMGVSFWGTLWRLLDPSFVNSGRLILTATTAFRSEPFQE